jgi:NSS family neurotransmitter:Na+ symporter
MLRDGAARAAHWSSHRAFVVAAVGATLGLGNAWRFPGLVAEHGGLAFVAVYLVALALLGLPLLLAELVLARRVPGALPVHFPPEVRLAQAAPVWRGWPWLVLAAAWLVLAVLLVIGTWLLGYLGQALLGGFGDPTPRAVALKFDALAAAPAIGVGWLTLFLGSAVAVSATGIRWGVERAARGGLLLVWLLWGGALVGVIAGGAGGGGFARLLVFDGQAMGAHGLLAALTQAFYTLVLGVGVVHAYATHLPAGGSLPRLAGRIVLADTLFALLATLVVLGLLAAAGLEPETGPRLLFEHLPLAFASVTGGGWLAAALYAGFAMLAWLTTLALLEPLVLALTAWRRLGRVRAALLVGVTLWLAGLLMLVSFAGSPGGRWAGHGPFGWLEFLGGRVLAPVAALLGALFVGWQVREEALRLVLPLVPEWQFRTWRVLLRFVVPPLLGLILLAVTGILPGPP